MFKVYQVMQDCLETHGFLVVNEATIKKQGDTFLFDAGGGDLKEAKQIDFYESCFKVEGVDWYTSEQQAIAIWQNAKSYSLQEEARLLEVEKQDFLKALKLKRKALKHRSKALELVLKNYITGRS